MSDSRPHELNDDPGFRQKSRLKNVLSEDAETTVGGSRIIRVRVDSGAPRAHLSQSHTLRSLRSLKTTNHQ